MADVPAEQVIPRPKDLNERKTPAKVKQERRERRRFNVTNRPRRKKKSVKVACIQILVALFGVVWVYFTNEPADFCDDPTKTHCPDRYYSQSYEEARDKFRFVSSVPHFLVFFALSCVACAISQ